MFVSFLLFSACFTCECVVPRAYTYTKFVRASCIYMVGVYILHLWIFEENAVDCVLYATKRQFQNKSLLGRICKFAVLSFFLKKILDFDIFQFFV
jgi:hypothetical protein